MTVGWTRVSLGATAAVLGLGVAACAGGTAARTESAATTPVDTTHAAATPSAFAPRVAAGTYTLRTNVERRTPAPAASRIARRGRPPQASDGTPLRLDATPLAVPDPTALSPTQFNATIAIPGYTRAPRGRQGQAASWWPIPGDSVVIHFAVQRDATIDLRGALRGSEMSGEIWYTSASGASFQLGTFTAVRRR